MKLSEFKNEKQNSQKTSAKSDADLMDKYNELKDLSHDDLSKKLIDEVARQKQNGTFNYNQILQTMESLKGFMPQENYENMKRILDTLK